MLFRSARDGAVRFLEEGGPVLGPLAHASYARGFVTMQPGDTLVFYTDGIVEARGRGEDGRLEEYGVPRLVRVASDHRGRPAEAIVDAIFDSVREFTADCPPEDDRTVMVLRYPAREVESPTMAFPRPARR